MMSDTEKQAASKTASETVAKEFANGKTQEVANQIYAALRYSTGKDGSTTDGALFTSLYDGAYSANAAETVYNEVVRQVLLKAAGQAADSKLTADQAAAGIKAAWAKGAQANVNGYVCRIGWYDKCTACGTAVCKEWGKGHTLSQDTEHNQGTACSRKKQ